MDAIENIPLVFDDACLLLTGGTGSFGNAVLRRLLKSNLREIRVLSRDEKTLYLNNTNGEYLLAFDVQPDGSLKNRRNFAKYEGVTPNAPVLGCAFEPGCGSPPIKPPIASPPGETVVDPKPPVSVGCTAAVDVLGTTGGGSASERRGTPPMPRT